jgi:lysophospholipase L1-like esterase
LAGFTSDVTLVRRHLARALVGLAGLTARSSAAPQATALAPTARSTAVTEAPPPIASLPSLGGPESREDVKVPVFSQRILRLRTRAQERILGRDQAIEDELGRVVPAQQVVLDDGKAPRPPNGNALGQFVPVENEVALESFHNALDALSNTPDQKNKVRIAVYGASHTQADIYSGYLRYYLQSRFGNGGPGFIPLGVERGWRHRIDFKIRASRFKVQYVQKKTQPPNGRFGLPGIAAVGGPNGRILISPENGTDPELTASQYGLFYAAEPFSGDIAISVDGEAPVRLPTRSKQLEARYHTFERPLGWHDVEIRSLGGGGARLFGLSVERAQPGLVLDNLGIRGTRAASMLHWDQALWEEHLRRRPPDLVLLAYGTNETTDRGQPIGTYTRDLRQVLTRLRHALPEASCVLVGPGDFPKAKGNVWVPRPRLLEIISEQRRLAPEFGCGFWDTYAFMGGEGSMDRWVRANPRLGSPDHIHLTPRGYVRMGMVLGDALMRPYDARRLPPDARLSGQRNSSAEPPVPGAFDSL